MTRLFILDINTNSMMKGGLTMTDMNRVLAFGLTLFGLGFCFASPCQAQPIIGNGGPPVVGSGGNFQQPVSPYLNLLNRNGSPVINYYGIVRPQLQAQANFQSLQNQINPAYANQSTMGYDQPSVTGHAFGFQNYRLYFQNQFTAGGFGVGMNQGASGIRTGQGPGGPTQGQGAAGARPPSTPQTGIQQPGR
jgi:hypothetical protein